jgi:putative polymerase
MQLSESGVRDGRASRGSFVQLPVATARDPFGGASARRARTGEGMFPPAVWEAVAVGIAVLAVIFNPLLAIVNGHVHPLSSGVVAAVQAALTFGALGVGAMKGGTPGRWIILAWALLVWFIGVSIVRDGLAAKDLGDVLLIPAFIAMGQRIRIPTLIRMVVALQVAITIIGVLELFFPSMFGTVFKVVDYYVSTRGFDKSAFWAGNDLFLSSERPGGRLLLPGFNFHRGSSLFLEPVSLGNWTVVVAIFLGGFWHSIPWRTRLLLAGCDVILLVVCDGRLAMGVCLFLALYLPFARRLPSALSILYLPAVLLLLSGLVAAGFLTSVGDTLPGRLRGGYDALIGLDLPDLMGVGHQMLYADAGWVYFIQTQSLLVAIAIWLVITLTDIGEGEDARMFKHGLAMFLALCLPISYSVLSIKTTSLLWCGYGALYARRALANARGARTGAAAGGAYEEIVAGDHGGAATVRRA